MEFPNSKIIFIISSLSYDFFDDLYLFKFIKFIKITINLTNIFLKAKLSAFKIYNDVHKTF